MAKQKTNRRLDDLDRVINPPDDVVIGVWLSDGDTLKNAKTGETLTRAEFDRLPGKKIRAGGNHDHN